jgi:hypothetical protein
MIKERDLLTCNTKPSRITTTGIMYISTVTKVSGPVWFKQSQVLISGWLRWEL